MDEPTSPSGKGDGPVQGWVRPKAWVAPPRRGPALTLYRVAVVVIVMVIAAGVGGFAYGLAGGDPDAPVGASLGSGPWADRVRDRRNRVLVDGQGDHVPIGGRVPRGRDAQSSAARGRTTSAFVDGPGRAVETKQQHSASAKCIYNDVVTLATRLAITASSIVPGSNCWRTASSTSHPEAPLAPVPDSRSRSGGRPACPGRPGCVERNSGVLSSGHEPSMGRRERRPRRGRCCVSGAPRLHLRDDRPDLLPTPPGRHRHRDGCVDAPVGRRPGHAGRRATDASRTCGGRVLGGGRGSGPLVGSLRI